jgi:hypothetical protein
LTLIRYYLVNPGLTVPQQLLRGLDLSMNGRLDSADELRLSNYLVRNLPSLP